MALNTNVNNGFFAQDINELINAVESCLANGEGTIWLPDSTTFTLTSAHQTATVLGGTSSAFAGSAFISGAGTTYLTNLKIGSYISITDGVNTEVHRICTINSDTIAFTISAFTNNFAGATVTVYTGIEIGGNTQIIGRGFGTVITADNTYIPDLIFAYGNGNKISSLTLNGNKAARGAIEQTYCLAFGASTDELSVLNCNIINSPSDGLNINPGSNIGKCQIWNNVFTDNANNDFNLPLSGSNTPTIDTIDIATNNFQTTGNISINMSGTVSNIIHIRNCSFVNAGASALTLANINRVSIINNSFNSSVTPLSINASSSFINFSENNLTATSLTVNSDNTIINDNLFANVATALTLGSNDRLNVSNNVINFTSIGINVTNTITRLDILGNNLQGPVGSGTGISVSGEITQFAITDNTINGVANGLTVSSPPRNGVINGNQVRAVTTNCLNIAAGTFYIIISGNNLNGPGTGLRVTATADNLLVSSNSFQAFTEAILVTGAIESSTFTGNTIVTSTIGIQITNTTAASISNTLISKNNIIDPTTGIDISDADCVNMNIIGNVIQSATTGIDAATTLGSNIDGLNIQSNSILDCATGIDIDTLGPNINNLQIIHNVINGTSVPVTAPPDTTAILARPFTIRNNVSIGSVTMSNLASTLLNPYFSDLTLTSVGGDFDIGLLPLLPAPSHGHTLRLIGAGADALTIRGATDSYIQNSFVFTLNVPAGEEVILQWSGIVWTPLKTSTTIISNPTTSPVPQIMQIVDQKANNANGGGSAAGWNIRTLNTVKTISGNVPFLESVGGSNGFRIRGDLYPGVYQIEYSAPIYRANRCKIALYSVTAGAFADIGESLYSDNSSLVQVTTRGTALLRITASTEYQVQQFVQTTATSTALGVAANSGQVEIYARVVAMRLTSDPSYA